MIRLAHPHRSDAGRHDYDHPDKETRAALTWSVMQERERFLNMPPVLQQARIEEVLDKLRREKARGKAAHSALWKLAWPVFGIDVGEL